MVDNKSGELVYRKLEYDVVKSYFNMVNIKVNDKRLITQVFKEWSPGYSVWIFTNNFTKIKTCVETSILINQDKFASQVLGRAQDFIKYTFRFRNEGEVWIEIFAVVPRHFFGSSEKNIISLDGYAFCSIEDEVYFKLRLDFSNSELDIQGGYIYQSSIIDLINEIENSCIHT